jgi:hypothetical protein
MTARMVNAIPKANPNLAGFDLLTPFLVLPSGKSVSYFTLQWFVQKMMGDIAQLASCRSGQVL